MNLDERKQLFYDALNFKKPERTPILSNFWTWKVLDSEYPLSEALYDWDVMYKVQSEFHERYEFDLYVDTGTRNPFALTESLGGNLYLIDEAREAVVIDDYSIVEDDEYPELASDVKKFYWTKALPRKCKLFGLEGSLETLLTKTIPEFLKLSEYTAKVNDDLVTKYQVPLFTNGFFFNGFETIFNQLRGIKNSALDLRRRKEALYSAIEALNDLNANDQILEGYIKNGNPNAVFTVQTGLLGHSILSVKQFGEIYWPFLKKLIDKLYENGKTLTVFAESDSTRFYEFFQDVPKGVVNIHLEQDNIFAARKGMPNITLTGGFPAVLLGQGTKEQCIDYAKKLIDEMGEGYIFSTDKMISYRYDCTRENLLAVNEFVRSYNP